MEGSDAMENSACNVKATFSYYGNGHLHRSSCFCIVSEGCAIFLLRGGHPNGSITGEDKSLKQLSALLRAPNDHVHRPHHVLHTIGTGWVHWLDLFGVASGDPMFLTFVVQKLDLPRVRKLDHGSDWQLEFSILRVVVPHAVSLV